MSAIDQYCEAIPSARGDRGNADADRGGLPYPAATERALERNGTDGQAIIGLSEQALKQAGKKATDSVVPQIGSAPATPHGAVGVNAGKASENPISALAAGFGDAGSTSGPLFGTALLALALVFFGLTWLRYRRRAQG